MKYDIGCGQIRLDGYVRVDIDPGVNPDIVGDVAKENLPIVSGCAEHIVCYHVLEHISHPGQLCALREMARILQSGGRIDIKVPHPASDSAMVPGHVHVISPHYWRQIATNPAAWMGQHWFNIVDVQEIVNEEALAACGQSREYAVKYLRNVATETHIVGIKP